MDERPTRAELEAMRREHEAGERRGAGLPYNLDEDLHQVRTARRVGLSLERLAGARDLPIEYIRVLDRHIKPEG